MKLIEMSNQIMPGNMNCDYSVPGIYDKGIEHSPCEGPQTTKRLECCTTKYTKEGCFVSTARPSLDHDSNMNRQSAFTDLAIRLADAERISLVNSFRTIMREIQEYWTQLEQNRRRVEEKIKAKKITYGSVKPSELGLKVKVRQKWSQIESKNCRNKQGEVDDVPTLVAYVGRTTHMKIECCKCLRRRDMKDASCQKDEEDYSLETLNFETTILNVLQPPPNDRMVQCRVVRNKKMWDTALYPVYRMYLEEDNRLLLIARKRKKCRTSKYLILTTEDDNLTRNSASAVGSLRSNLVGTRFRLTTYKTSFDDAEVEEDDSALVVYETNVLGSKGPRKFKVLLPPLDESKNSDILELINKSPEWDGETSTHFLYFRGRVTKRSVKNFQLCKVQNDSVLLQFGKIERDEFTLDFQNPLNAVQAFAITLSSFDHKIACE